MRRGIGGSDMARAAVWVGAVVVFAGMVGGPCAGQAPSSEKELFIKLVGRPLYLKALVREDKLKFDASGRPEGRYSPASFTVCGIDVTQVTLRGDRLRIEGERMGVEFDRDERAQRVPLTVGDPRDGKPEGIVVEVNGHGQKEFGPAVDAIFAEGLAPLVPQMPEIWQNYAKLHLLPAPEGDAPRGRQMVREPGALRLGAGVVRPKLLHQAEPEFSEEARRMKFSGNVMVYLWVGENGLPTHIRIARPAGLGLDEQAVASAKAYRFSPATKDGEAVTTELYVEVNFQVF